MHLCKLNSCVSYGEKIVYFIWRCAVVTHRFIKCMNIDALFKNHHFIYNLSNSDGLPHRSCSSHTYIQLIIDYCISITTLCWLSIGDKKSHSQRVVIRSETVWENTFLSNTLHAFGVYLKLTRRIHLHSQVICKICIQ